MSKNQIISARIMVLVAQGLSVKDAWDAVLGQGSYDQFVSDLYDALQIEVARRKQA